MERWKLAFLIGLGCQVPMASAQIKAFEEAEGFGAYATGARTSLGSASVYHVTNLNDSGAGSFRDAVSQANRFVVFDVGGIINLGSNVVVKNNVTIAGQTAPGGVSTFGAKVSYSGASNTITRHMAYRLGRAMGREDASGASNGANMMFDHMSITWGVDETLSFNSDGKGTLLNNITVQNSVIGQGLDSVGHSASGLMTFPEGSRFSLIRNLFTDSVTRNPKVRGENEFINNVVYGYESAAYIMGDTVNMESHANAIGNYFLWGESQRVDHTGTLININPGAPFRLGSPNFHIYGSDNFVDTNRNGVLDGTEISAPGGPGYPGADVVATPFAFPTQNAMSAQDAVAYVLKHVGPSIVRDAVDQRIVDELASYGTFGKVILRETDLFPGYGTDAKYLNPRARLEDADNDGMPDNWERAHGLNPNLNNVSEWRALMPDGRTRLEQYLNELGRDGETILSTGGDWANAATWSGAQPTLADSAVVVGNLTVTGGNAFARRLAVGGNLSITGGTLDVFDTAQVDGTLSITGGTATFGRILLSSAGTNGALTLSAGSTIQTGPIASGGGTALLTFDGGTFKALGAPNISVPTLITAAGGTINTNGYSGTLSGGLSGTGTLIKTGAGTLTLGGDNTAFTGGISLTQGTIAFASTGANSGTGVVTMSNGTSFVVATSNTTTPMALANGATVTANVAGNTYGGTITGPANSTLTLNSTSTGASNFSLGGNLSGFAGTINLGSSTGNVRINQGGSALANFNLGTGSATLRTAFGNTTNLGSLAGGASTKLTGPTNDAVATTFAVGANNTSTTFAGTIGDGSFATPAAVSLTKVGTGTLTLTNAASTYTGATTINAGTLSVATLANGGATSSIGASTSDAANLVLNGGTLRYTGAAATIDRSFTLTENGGTIERNGTGNFVLAGGDTAMAGTGDRTLTLSGTSTSFNNFNNGLADPTGGKLSLVKNDVGTWRLGGNAKTYSGDTRVEAGTLYLLSGGVLPTGTGKGNVHVAGGATLDLFGSSHTINGLNGAGTLTTTINTARTLTVGNGDADGTFGGTLTQGEGQTLALTKIGAGTQTLLGVNTYTGATTVAGGTLALPKLEAATAGYTTNAGGTLKLLNVDTAANLSGRSSIAAARLTNNGRLDVGQTGVTIVGGDAAAVRAQLISGRNGGAWNGASGITSSTAAATANRAVGYVAAGGNVTVAYAAPGDTDLDHTTTSADIQRVLASNKFNQGPTNATWAEGDFNYDGQVSSADIQAVLASNTFNQGSYALTGASADRSLTAASLNASSLNAVAPGSDGDGVVTAVYNAQTGNVTFDTDGVTMNGFILLSAGGVFTGEAAKLPAGNFFNVDNNNEISTGFASIGDAYDLGNVASAGLTAAFLQGDLTFTYTIPNTAGIAVGDLRVVGAVPEPATLALLAGLGGLALRRRRRALLST